MSEVATPVQPTATPVDAVASAVPKSANNPSNVPAAAKAPEPVKAEAPKPVDPEFFEVPVDGKKQRMSKEELFQAASLGKAAHKRFEEAAQIRKQNEELVSLLKNPEQLLERLHDPKLGLNPQQIREGLENYYKRKYIDPEAMSPEQRALAEAQERLKAYEEKEKLAAQEREKQESQAQDEQTAKSIQDEIIKTVEESKLPKTKFTVSRIAYWTRVNEAKGLNAPRELIINQVRKEMREVMDGLLQSSDGDTLFDLLGDATVKKVRSHDLAKIRARRQAVIQPPKPEVVVEPRKTERITEAEVSRRMRELWK